MKPERLPVFLRAHTVKVQEKEKSPWVTAKSPQWPDRVLLFDTETRTSIDQTFIFGIYRICEFVDGQYRCTEEGVFFEGFSKQQRKVIGKFAANSFPDVEVPSFPPNVRFSVYGSLLEFTEHKFFPALRKGWLIAGFNLPFDLSPSQS